MACSLVWLDLENLWFSRMWYSSLKLLQWYATRALALRTDSFLFSASQIAGFTGNDQRNRPNLSMSPDSSRVSQTWATWFGWKLNKGVLKGFAAAACGAKPGNIGNGAGRKRRCENMVSIMVYCRVKCLQTYDSNNEIATSFKCMWWWFNQ